MGGVFFASLHLYISIAERPSLTILPDVHMYKASIIKFQGCICGQFSDEEMWCWESMFGGYPGGGGMLFLITNE